MRNSTCLRQTFFALVLIAAVAHGGVNVLTYHNDNSRTGDNLSETILTPASVNANTFGKLFTYAVDGDVYAQPLYVSGLSIPGKGIRNVVFVATEHNSVYAFDADSNAGASGGLLWQANLGPSVTTPNTDFGNRYGGFTQIEPETGITGTPVIDAANQTLYVDSFTQEGSNYLHKMHALNIATGRERSFSPVIVSATMPGNGVGSANGILVFSAEQELQRCALTLSKGIVYVPYAGYGDTDPYHGWILGFNASNLRLSPSQIFNDTPNATIADFGTNAGEAGIWMAGGGLSADSSGNLYLTTGNGSFNAFNGADGTEYGDCFLKLSTAHGISVVDWFAPYNQLYLADNDLDLGSGGVLLLPKQPGPVPNILVGAGKPGVVYVMNRDMFTDGNNHYNTNGDSDAILQSVQLNGGNYSTPTYFNGMVYMTASGTVTLAFTVSNGVLSTVPSSFGARTFPYPGATASVSANGSNDSLIWMIARANPATLVADDANNVSTEIYNSDQAGDRDQLPAGIKFAVPTVAGGKVFVGGHQALSVFGLLPLNNPPNVGTYNGLFYESDGVQLGQSGYVTVTVSANGHYVARFQTASTLYSFTGQFYGSGVANDTLTIAHQSPIQIQLQYVAGNPAQLTGTIGNGTWVAEIAADQEVFNARTHSAPFAGNYTLVIPGPNDGNQSEPQGNGYGTFSIGASGQLKFQGTLADGTPVSQTTAISQNAQWPLFVSLYGGRGQLMGWVDFTNAAGSDLSGEVMWAKLPIARAASYAGGFDVTSALEGSRFTAGSAKAPALDFNAGVVSLSAGNLASSMSNSFTVAANGKLLPASGLTLNFSESSGRFSGTMPNPVHGRAPLSFSGVFLTKENYGAGYFVSSNLSGAVYLGAK
jgi:hypothetical protein